MARVTLNIGGRSHVLACRDGDEAHVESLGARLNAMAGPAQRGAGAAGPERMMVLIALMLADALEEAEQREPPAPAAPEVVAQPPADDGAAERLAEALAELDRQRAEHAATLAHIAERLETFASALEQPAPTP